MTGNIGGLIFFRMVIGCSLSHFKAWQALLDSGQDCAFLRMMRYLSHAPCIEALVAMADKLDIVMLENRNPKRKQIKVADMSQVGALSVVRYNNSFGSASYFITTHNICLTIPSGMFLKLIALCIIAS